ncbi:uncharacterized protein LOC121049786 [Rosa chinensis]|uniref:uncharacterized protein LOC121049786 n=1 Tax=Rosa chinensis TaxID=74649 RepID=UPI001AD90981|nr:uncharacterized protein LOC121049786 [Rosa chinensis]
MQNPWTRFTPLHPRDGRAPQFLGAEQISVAKGHSNKVNSRLSTFPWLETGGFRSWLVTYEADSVSRDAGKVNAHGGGWLDGPFVSDGGGLRAGSGFAFAGGDLNGADLSWLLFSGSRVAKASPDLEMWLSLSLALLEAVLHKADVLPLMGTQVLWSPTLDGVGRNAGSSMCGGRSGKHGVDSFCGSADPICDDSYSRVSRLSVWAPNNKLGLMWAHLGPGFFSSSFSFRTGLPHTNFV